MELTFEKWEDGRWFVVLPDYDGPQEDLEMVDGADKFLDVSYRRWLLRYSRCQFGR